ncbi:aspartic peptidase domain-containing protein [Lipomyces japonicus]|uniref:aspartic peptidase domain-containing protein n=1 Tax=Lipomyces japonicus TaxID=56871 RepID=UPI0034CE93B8
MKVSASAVLVAAAAFAVVPEVLASSLSSASSSSIPGTVQFDIVRQKVPAGHDVPFNARHRRRVRSRRDNVKNTVEQLLDNSLALYYANVSLGTPPQSLRLQIDTGSSDVWVQSGENEVCQESSDPCAESGIFEPDQSSTFDDVSPGLFSIRYGDYSYAKGDYATDTFHIGGVSVKNLTVGVATDANATQGIMGIGYSSNEAIVSQQGSSSQYSNLPDLLVAQGFIQTRAYSLWLNDLQASTGSILFGGIDTKKFTGDLVTVPILKYTGEETPSEFYVSLTGLSLTDDNEQTTLTTSENAVLLDSGTSFIYLPSAIQRGIASAVGAKYNSQLGFYVESCSVQNVSASVDFEFEGVTIKVPMSEIFYPAISTDGTQITFTNGEDVCLLSVLPDTDIGVSILGDTFLRSAYVVYDLDNEEIGLAQTVFDSEDSNIVAISSSIPSASAASETASATLSVPASSATGDNTGSNDFTESLFTGSVTEKDSTTTSTSTSSRSRSATAAGTTTTTTSQTSRTATSSSSTSTSTSGSGSNSSSAASSLVINSVFGSFAVIVMIAWNSM